MRASTAVVDTGAGPSVIRSDMLPDDWKSAGIIVPKSETRRIQDANGNIVHTKATVQLTFVLGPLTATFQFLVVDTLAVPILLGCDFINQYVKCIKPREGRIDLEGGGTTFLIRTDIKKSSITDTTIRVAKYIELAPMSETNVLVQTSAEGLCTLYSVNQNTLRKKTEYAMANGLAELQKLKPFIVRVLNFSSKPISLQKHAVIGFAHAASSEDQFFILPTSTDRKEEFDTENSVLSKSDDEWIHDVNLDHLEAETQHRIQSLLRKHASMWNGELGELSITKHRIDLQENAKPAYQAPYRAGKQSRDIERQEVDRMLKAGVIEPATSEWASPVVLITKKDGSIRFCVDYRKLNALTVKDSYPLPRMDECLDSLGDATIFSTLDCNSGYWQIPIEERDRDKTAFVTHCGVHRFKRMPFGLCNAPATFQRALDMLLSKVKWKYALVYLDDVIIYSKSIDEHFEHLDYVLSILRNAGATLKLSKCHFFQSSVDYLGHVVYPGKLAVAQKNIDTLAQAHYPSTRTELRSFLGMCNVYRKFVSGFAKIAAPLTDMLRKGEPDTFDDLTEAQAHAFSQLKNALINPPILTLPRESAPYTLDVDACDSQLGACLQQEQPDGTLAPCGFYSRTLNQAEKNYSTPEKECLAMVWAILLLRPYLERKRFTIRTDEVALKWLLSLKDPSGRLARWRLRLAEFEFSIQYRPGIKNSLADGCSRVTSQGGDTNKCDDAIPTFIMETDETEYEYDEDCYTIHTGDNHAITFPEAITLEDIFDAQQVDDECREWKKTVNIKGTKFHLEGQHRKELLYRSSTENSELRLVIPASLRKRLLYLSHYPVTAGHPGIRKMYKTISQHYYWPGLSMDVYQTVKKCSHCAREAGLLRKRKQHVSLFPAHEPLEFLAIDILGPLPKTPRGNQFILVVCDRFTKLVRTIPLRTITSLAVAQAFCYHWVFVYGMPKTLLSDNGTQFSSKFFQACCIELGIKQVFTTAYHPQCNGQVERFNRTILSQLRAYVGEHQNDWDLYHGALTYSYNNQIHSSTGVTPFELVLSRPPPQLAVQLPIPVTNKPTDASLTEGGIANGREQFIRRLRGLLPRVRRALDEAGQRYKTDADRKVLKHQVADLAGQRVWVRSEVVANKLAPKFTGPYTVIRATDKVVEIFDKKGAVSKISYDRVVQEPTAIQTSIVRDIDSNRESHYIVDHIVSAHKDRQGHIWFRVRWEGYEADEDTYEPEEHLTKEMVHSFYRRVTLKRLRVEEMI